MTIPDVCPAGDLIGVGTCYILASGGGAVLVPARIHQCLFLVNVILLLTHDKWYVQPLSYVNGNLYNGSAEGGALLIYVCNPYMYICLSELHDQM